MQFKVADCFHLLQNLEEVLEKVFKGPTQLLKKVENHQLQASKQPVTPFPEPQDISPSEKEQNRARRPKTYEHTHELRQQGYLIKTLPTT